MARYSWRIVTLKELNPEWNTIEAYSFVDAAELIRDIIFGLYAGQSLQIICEKE